MFASHSKVHYLLSFFPNVGDGLLHICGASGLQNPWIQNISDSLLHRFAIEGIDKYEMYSALSKRGKAREGANSLHDIMLLLA